ncbi:hypothetical protein ABTE17_21920, partial [Acinetobacter baumannii]
MAILPPITAVPAAPVLPVPNLSFRKVGFQLMSLSRQLQTRLTLSGTAAALLTAIVLTAMAMNG